MPVTATKKIRSAPQVPAPLPRKLPPRAFICQAGMIVKNPDKCEHCGADDDDICGRLPGVMQQKIDALAAELSELLSMFNQDKVRFTENASLAHRQVLDRARAAISRAIA